VTDEARKLIAREGYSPEFGARNIARMVQDQIKHYFVDAVLFGELAGGGKAVADVEEGKIVIRAGGSKEPAKASSRAAQPSPDRRARRS